MKSSSAARNEVGIRYARVSLRTTAGNLAAARDSGIPLVGRGYGVSNDWEEYGRIKASSPNAQVMKEKGEWAQLRESGEDEVEVSGLRLSLIHI